MSADLKGQLRDARLQISKLDDQLRETRFQLNQKAFQLETLYETGLSLGASLQIEAIVGEFLLLSVAMVDARAGFLLLREEGHRRLSVAQQANLDDAQLELFLAGELGEKLKQAMRSGATLHLDSADLPQELDSQYLLAIPVGDEGLLGVLDKETRQGFQAFSEVDAHLLALTGQQAGTALANARLYRSIAEEKNLVQSIGNGVISTNLKGAIVRVNPAVERIFADEERFVGKSCAPAGLGPAANARVSRRRRHSIRQQWHDHHPGQTSLNADHLETGNSL